MGGLAKRGVPNFINNVQFPLLQVIFDSRSSHLLSDLPCCLFYEQSPRYHPSRTPPDTFSANPTSWLLRMYLSLGDVVSRTQAHGRSTLELTSVNSSKTYKLNTGAEMPAVGLGTWQSKPGQVEKAVEAALRAGYTHIDTAYAYGNEKEVGQGIKASGVPREKIWLTTKLDNDWHKHVAEAIDTSLKNLDTPYVDLYLMHWPASLDKQNPKQVIKDQAFYKDNRV